MALSYDVGVYILYYRLDFFRRQSGAVLDFAEIVQELHSHSAIFTISVKKSHDARALSMRAHYDYLKSLRSFLGPK